MDDSHFYSIFITYRFNNSMRRDERFIDNVDTMRKIQIREFLGDALIPDLWMQPCMDNKTK